MKRRTKFIIGFASAALTFGTLMATIGPRHHMRHRHCCEQTQENKEHKTTTPSY